MSENREVCWFLTLRCNQQCRYCHRFLGINELNFEDNKKILDRITEDGIKNITFTGGEALLHPNFFDLLKMASERGIKCKLITNGSLLASNPKMREIFNYLDSLTLSIDAVDNDINEKLGRGYNHVKDISVVLEALREYDLKVNINTVVNRMNLEDIEELGQYLGKYRINAWRVFKFIPLRETAKLNEKEFEISRAEFKMIKTICLCMGTASNISKVEFREEPDMESKYLLIMPNGNIMVTENGEDVCIGNVLEDSITELLKNRTTIKASAKKVFEKIRTLVAYKDDKVRNEILDTIKGLGYVDVIGITDNGTDTYNEIVNLQPEMVFTNYDFSDMNGLDIIKKSKEQLDTKIPVFNLIGNDIPDEEYKEFVNVAGIKMNTLITNPNKDRIVGIFEDYKEFKEN